MRWEAQNGYSETYGDMLIEYTADIFTYPEDKMIEYEASLDASMNYCTIYKYNDNHVPEEREQFGVIRIYESYDPSNSNPFFTLKTRYSISLSNCFPAVGSAGYLRIKGDVYQKGKRVSTASFNRRIYVSVGIGTNHDNILWYSGDDEWTHVKHKFSMWVGLDDSEWWAEGIIRVPNNSNLTGQVIVEIYGSDNLEMIDGQRQFDIRDFSVTMDSPTEKNIFDSVRTGLPDRKVEIISEQTYSATQQIGNRDIVDISPVFASFNKFPFAKNFIMDSTGEYQRGIPYDLHDLTDLTHPEQYLADRISAFWTNARHLLKSEYILNTNTNANPVRIYTQDNKHYYPMVIAHDWRDDIVKLSLIEV